MATSIKVDKLNDVVDWFIPADMVNDLDMRKQARIFLYSHLFGPFIGNTVPLALYCFDPKPGLQITILAAAISGFWLFPFLLRTFGHYYLLATISIENLIFCILWSCYFYGGVTSPTLPWVLTIPLLALFYVGSSPLMRLVVLALFAVNLAGFLYLYNVVGHPVSSMPVGAMQSLGIVSTVATSLYVTMMALFYANALAAQVEFGARCASTWLSRPSCASRSRRLSEPAPPRAPFWPNSAMNCAHRSTRLLAIARCCWKT